MMKGTKLKGLTSEFFLKTYSTLSRIVEVESPVGILEDFVIKDSFSPILLSARHSFKPNPNS